VGRSLQATIPPGSGSPGGHAASHGDPKQSQGGPKSRTSSTYPTGVGTIGSVLAADEPNKRLFVRSEEIKEKKLDAEGKEIPGQFSKETKIQTLFDSKRNGISESFAGREKSDISELVGVKEIGLKDSNNAKRKEMFNPTKEEVDTNLAAALAGNSTEATQITHWVDGKKRAVKQRKEGNVSFTGRRGHVLLFENRRRAEEDAFKLEVEAIEKQAEIEHERKTKMEQRVWQERVKAEGEADDEALAEWAQHSSIRNLTGGISILFFSQTFTINFSISAF
jgi:hypothetical protein